MMQETGHAEDKIARVKDVIRNEESLRIKLEDKLNNSLIEHDSLSAEEVLVLHNRIESLRHQNEAND